MPPSPKVFRSQLRTAQRLGAWQVTLSSGEGIDHIPEIHSTVRYYGFQTWFDYIKRLCELTLEAKGQQPLMPVLDIGPLPTLALRKLAPVVPMMRLTLDTVDPAVAEKVHADAPQKSPLLRSLALSDAGRAGVPIATGIRVGMGESPESWVEAVKIVNEVHKQYNNIMTFNVIPFVPEPFSALATSCPCSNDLLAQAIKTVRRHLAPGITLVAEVYKRLALAPDAVVSGAFDLGPIHIADNERFDLDMLNAVSHTRELLEKLSVSVECTPVVRPSYEKQHRLPQAVETNLRRFDKLTACAGSELDTPASGQSVTVG